MNWFYSILWKIAVHFEDAKLLKWVIERVYDYESVQVSFYHDYSPTANMSTINRNLVPGSTYGLKVTKK